MTKIQLSVETRLIASLLIFMASTIKIKCNSQSTVNSQQSPVNSHQSTNGQNYRSFRCT
ncbi:MAG: hypothetical protein KME64_25760 [Scytonematopsis contorta HA4267-MV1]|nr:hypothetical protein [Scytonematopsis contorta HA4267-MV1]